MRRAGGRDSEGRRPLEYRQERRRRKDSRGSRDVVVASWRGVIPLRAQIAAAVPVA